MEDEKQIKIDDLKCELYGLLLQKDQKEITNNEVEIMFYLMKDKAIQDKLEKVFKNGK